VFLAGRDHQGFGSCLRGVAAWTRVVLGAAPQTIGNCDSVQPGYAVRLRPSGAKTLVFEHTRPGMKGTFPTTIGPCPRVKAQAGRKQARILAGQHAGGADLVEERRAAKKAARAAARATAATLGALIAKAPDGEPDGPYEASLKARGVVATPTALSALRRN